MRFGDLINGDSEQVAAKCEAVGIPYRQPTLAERVHGSIKNHEDEIVKLREIEKLLSENPQIEQLINALGSVSLRY